MPTCSPPPPWVGGRSPPRRTPSVGRRQSLCFQASFSSSSKNSDAAENTDEVFSRSLILIWSSAAMQVMQSVGSDLHFPLPTYRPPHPPSGQRLPLQVRAPSFLPTTGPTTHLRERDTKENLAPGHVSSFQEKKVMLSSKFCVVLPLFPKPIKKTITATSGHVNQVQPVFAQSHALLFRCSPFTLDAKNGTAIQER